MDWHWFVFCINRTTKAYYDYMALISGSLHWTVLADNIQFACLNTKTLCTLHTFAVSRGSGMVAAVAASDGGVTTDGYGAQEYRKIRGQTHAAATARPVAVIAAAPQSCYRRRREAVRPDDARRPILDGHTVNRTEAAAVATSHTATVMSRADAAATPEAVAAMSPPPSCAPRTALCLLAAAVPC